jgi:lysophospholipase L1-like esterase
MRRVAACLVVLPLAAQGACGVTHVDGRADVAHAVPPLQPRIAPRRTISAAPVSTKAELLPPNSAQLGPTPVAACAPADLELPAFDVRVVPDSPQPVVDAAGNLNAFYMRMLAVARKTATGHLRIAMFGDSNMTMDYITGGMRRVLQAKYGDAGHGYVAFARPWGWYRHRDMRHEVASQGWKQLATSTHQTSDGHYGLANIAAESVGGGAWAYAETADAAAPIGKSVSSIDLFYMGRTFGGDFTVRIDGKDQEDVSTKTAAPGAQVRHYDVPEGAHRIGVMTKSGAVRMFGATFELAGASVVVDSFGTGALNYEQLLHVTDESRVPMLQRRKYDLVIFLLGTNMFAPIYHREWVQGTIERFRRSRADLPILLLSPPDMETYANALHSDPRIVKVGAQIRAIAAESNVGFWDFQAAMGGDLGMQKFAKAGLAEWDLIHFREAGGMLMGERLAHALTNATKQFELAHVGAGCTDSAPAAAAPATPPN